MCVSDSYIFFSTLRQLPSSLFVGWRITAYLPAMPSNEVEPAHRVLSCMSTPYFSCLLRCLLYWAAISLCVCVCIYTLLEFLDRSSICRRSFRCASLPLLVKYKKKRRRKNAVRAESCRVAEPPANIRIHFKVNKQNILHFSLFFTIPGLRRKQPVSYYFYVFFLSLNNWIPPSIIIYIFEN